MNIKRAPRRTFASAAALLAVAALAFGSRTTASGSVAPAGLRLAFLTTSPADAVPFTGYQGHAAR